MDIQKLKESIIMQGKQDVKDASILYLIDRLEKAEAQLAKLAAQEPEAVKFSNGIIRSREEYPDKNIFKERCDNETPLFARPAPPVPFVVRLRQFDEFSICHFGASEDYAKGYIDAQNNANKAIKAAGGEIADE